ncbi:MAG: flagellin [Candidatus Latescibacteria bacterium]|nr:flagellin [bacterium]MBD3425252.1 flagellin [Candidatus Latescibacterota bacterium]
MSFRINHNISSLNSLRNLSNTENTISKSLERLSSGLRVTRGADDPAGLVISENMRAQITGIRQAIENGETATAMIQTAEGAMNEVHNLLNSIRELALHAANEGSNDSVMLSADQDEIDNAIATINRIADQTQFGTKKLLDGTSGMSGSATDSEVTYLSADENTVAGTYAITITTAAEQAVDTAGTGQTANLAADETVTINGVDINLTSGMTQDQVKAELNNYNSSTGVTVTEDASNQLVFTSDGYGTDNSISVVSDTAAAATSTGIGTTAITDTGVDVAGTIGGLAATGDGLVLTGDDGTAIEGLSISTAHAAGAAGSVTVNDNALVFQVGANSNQTVEIAINSLEATTLGTGVTDNMFNNLSEISVLTSAQAQDAIEVIDEAIQEVSQRRGDLGGFQKNTLESNAKNLAVAEENLVATESIIRDTDFASEMARLTKNQILLQSGTAMLTQANQMPQVVLQLLS